jgi:hypothetical protein
MKSKAPNIRILTIREQKVVLDSDFAAVYGAIGNDFRRILPSS